jgi:rubrerythrin
MTRERAGTKTEANLLVALAGEADANRRYLAYGIRALNEGRADIAQLFFEAAGAETIHALNHLATMGAIGTTRENLQLAATGEVEEIEVVLPRMIREAEEEGRADAAESFRLALDRERHHRDMFRTALKDFDRAGVARGVAAVIPVTQDLPRDGESGSRATVGTTTETPRASRGGVGGAASAPQRPHARTGGRVRRMSASWRPKAPASSGCRRSARWSSARRTASSRRSRWWRASLPPA